MCNGLSHGRALSQRWRAGLFKITILLWTQWTHISGQATESEEWGAEGLRPMQVGPETPPLLPGAVGLSGHTRGSQLRPHPPARAPSPSWLSGLRAALGLALLPRRALPRLVLQGPWLRTSLRSSPLSPRVSSVKTPNPQLPARTGPVHETTSIQGRP